MIHKLFCVIGIHCWTKPYSYDERDSLERTCLVCSKVQRLLHCPDGFWKTI